MKEAARKETDVRNAKRWTVAGVIAAAAGATIGFACRGTAAWKRLHRASAPVRGALRLARGRIEGVAYRFAGREPDPAATDHVLADRVRSSLGRTERELDVPRVHVMVEHHIALLHGAVGTRNDAEEIERVVAAVAGIAGVESYLHVGLGAWDTRPSAGRAVQPPSAAWKALAAAAEKGGVDATIAPVVVRGVLATFADRLPRPQLAHLSSNLPDDVRLLFTPPRRIRGASRVRSLRDLVGRIILTTTGIPLERAEEVTKYVVHALRTLVPGDVREVSAVLPPELKALWGSAETP
jgi:uncharacterized protein (DUF2267 family)